MEEPSASDFREAVLLLKPISIFMAFKLIVSKLFSSKETGSTEPIKSVQTDSLFFDYAPVTALPE